MRKLLVVLLFVSAPLFAQERNIHLTIWGSQVDMEGDTDLGDFEADFDDGKALGVSANYGLNRWFSVEGSVFLIRSDATLGFEDASLELGAVDLVPFTLGGQVHFLGESSRIDPYIGAGGAYVVADDLSSSDLDTLGLGRIELENQATYYLNAGVGIRIAGGFGITVDGRQIQYEPSSRSTTTGVEQDLDLSPRILSVGLRLRF